LATVARDVLAALPAELAGIRTLWVTNDIAPLLVHDGRVTRRVVAIGGTGTGFCALNPEGGTCAKTSGHDYLLSDEGGGFDIGLQGLRAVMRAFDGRGPKTCLSDLLSRWQNIYPKDLPTLVYSSDEPKVLVASFAKFVLEAAEQGDPCSSGIIDFAASEIALGIVTAANRVGLEGDYEILLFGSNLVSPSHSILRVRLRRILEDRARDAVVNSVSTSPLAAVAQLSDIIEYNPNFAGLLTCAVPFGRFEPAAIS